MGKNLANEEDRRGSQEMSEGSGNRKFLKFPDVITPFYFPPLDYADGHVHWVHLPNGNKMRVPCLAGSDAASLSDECGICARSIGMYKEAKQTRDNPRASKDDRLQAEALKKEADGLRRRFECQMVAIQGITVTLRGAVKAGKQTYRHEAEFPTEGDQVAKIGIISLSDSQYKTLVGLVSNPEYPFMKEGKDLQNRVIWSFRGKNESGNQKVFFRPESKTISTPLELGEGWTGLDLTKGFTKNPELVAKVIRLLDGVEQDDSSLDDAVEREVEGEMDRAVGAESTGPDLNDVGDGFLDDDPRESLADERAPRSSGVRGGRTMPKGGKTKDKGKGGKKGK
jgi:hypothetical protein